MCYLQVWSKLQVLKQNRRNCSMVEILDLSELAALSDKILPKFFFFWKNFPFFSWTSKYAISKFRCKNADFVFRAKFLNSRTTGHFSLLFSFFFFIEFYTCFLDNWIYYLHVFKQKWQLCILVEILDLSELGAFLYKIESNFFFLSIEFSLFSWTTKYYICKCWCKNADHVFQPKFLTCWTKGHFRTNFALFFFFYFFL